MTSNVSPPAAHGLRRRSWLLVLVVGVASYLLVLHTLVATQNTNFFPSLILLGSVIVPATVLIFTAAGGGRVLAPAGLVAIVAILGGVIGTVAAGTLEYDALHGLGALPMIFVGLIEESAKLIVPLAVLVFVRNYNPRAGVVIGVASGAGFATLETMGYGFTALLSARSIAAVDQTLLLRALLAPAGHVAWTGLTVAALWALGRPGPRRRRVGRLLVTFVAAVLLHAAWDGFNSLIVHVVVATISLTALLVAIRRSQRDEPAVEPSPARASAR